MDTNTELTRQEIYTLIGRLEQFAEQLAGWIYSCYSHYVDSLYGALEVEPYAEKLFAYIRATRDEQVIMDCCKIDSSPFFALDEEYFDTRAIGRFYKMSDNPLQVTEAIKRYHSAQGATWDCLCRNGNEYDELCRQEAEARDFLITVFPDYDKYHQNILRLRESPQNERVAMEKTVRWLREIHDFALKEIWGVSRDDIKWRRYYIDTVEGVCKNRLTGEVLPKLAERAATASTLPAEASTLPDELATPEALKYLARGRELGLYDEKYNWLKGIQLCACFAREMSLKLDLGKGENSDGTPRISWLPFERLFHIQSGKLRSNYNDILKINIYPSDIALIDKIFN